MHSPMQLILSFEPDILHLRTFSCTIRVRILPPQRTKMGFQCQLGIYIGFDSPLIIRYLEPMTCDLFTARFADCHFDKIIFPSIGNNRVIIVSDKPKPVEIFSWNEQNLSHLDPRTFDCENEVNRIIHLQNIANRLPNTLMMPVTSRSLMFQLRILQLSSLFLMNMGDINESANQTGPSEHAPDVEPNASSIIKITNPGNIENPISYCNEIWDPNEIIINDIFAFLVAQEIVNNDYDSEPHSIIECC
ncbi:hypothetical protein Pfo_014611 [Paulownia fortunei]|nr:hypothetical protein Pfo_014611 [Paulownia fortunei]